MSDYRLYKIYTLTFVSPFELLGQTQMLNPSSQVDYKINQVTEPISYPMPDIADAYYKPWSVASPSFYYLDLESIATYRVDASGYIDIYIYPESNYLHMLPFLYDTILSVALAYRDIFTMKASAVLRKSDGFAQLFCAQNNGGKSTLSTVLLHNGYKFISDDRVLLEWDEKEQRYLTSCLAPKVEIWNNVSAEFLRGPHKLKGYLQHSHSVRPQLPKDYFYLSEEVVAKGRSPITSAFLITLLNDDEKTSYKTVEGLSKVQTLLAHIYHHHIIDYLGKSKQTYQFLSRLCQQLDMLSINRAQNAPFVEFVHLVVERMGTDMSLLKNNQ